MSSDPNETDRLFAVDLQLALGAVSEVSGLSSDDLPRWVEQSLLLYGRACFDKGEKYAHDKDTLVSSPRSGARGSGVYPELADAIAESLEDPRDSDDEPTQPGRKHPRRR
jgi:hypothetical protein